MFLLHFYGLFGSASLFKQTDKKVQALHLPLGLCIMIENVCNMLISSEAQGAVTFPSHATLTSQIPENGEGIAMETLKIKVTTVIYVGCWTATWNEQIKAEKKLSKAKILKQSKCDYLPMSFFL